jgi:tetratricopeptide (TPR) repeat protein
MARRWVGIVIATTALAILGFVLFSRSWRGAGNPDIGKAMDAYSRGHWEKTAAEARAVLKAEPSNREGLLLLARASARQKKDETAEMLYRRLGTEFMKAEDYLLLAKGLFRRGQPGPAQAVLAVARLSDPDNPEVLEAVLQYQFENQGLTQAAEAAERLMSKPGWEVRGMAALAQIRHALLEPAAAASLIHRALTLDAKLSDSVLSPHEARRLLASCLLETGKAAEARKELEGLIRSRPGSDAESTWLLSRALLMEGNLSQARVAAQEAHLQGVNNPLQPEPARFVGAASCERCHLKEFKTQQQSSHARTLIRGKELQSLPWPEQPITERSDSRVSHTFSRTDRGIECRTAVGETAFASLITYAMGTNHHGRTFLGQNGERQTSELRISQYPSEPLWALTLEHPVAPAVPSEFVGRQLDEEPVRKCIHCHSTNFRAAQYPEGRPEARDHGIGCERCHGPGEHHIKAVETKFPDLAIARPSIAPADQVVALCGQCHTTVEAMLSSKPSSIRFQAPNFVQSRCYTESGSFSCVTCHNPHRNAGRNASEYEKVCLECHPSPEMKNDRLEDSASRKQTWAPCPKRPDGDCLSCHMPRIGDAVPRAVFTDHFIRVRFPSGPG